MIGTLIDLISWFFNLPFWVFVVIMIGLGVLSFIIRMSDAGGSGGYSSGGYSSSGDNDYNEDNYSTNDYTYVGAIHENNNQLLSGVEHPFYFYDYAGNRCFRGGCFYDSHGERRSWGDGFYDGKGYYRNWGESFYDAAGNYRSWGDCFTDAQGNLVYPNW